MSDRDSIRKLQFRYSQCQGGDLHTGELMNMVCVDSSCQHRGLICPICRMETHETHYILPLKSFLQQVQTLFVHGSGESGDLNNLSDYLRNL